MRIKVQRQVTGNARVQVLTGEGEVVNETEVSEGQEVELTVGPADSADDISVGEVKSIAE